MSQLKYQEYTIGQHLRVDKLLYILLIAGIVLKQVHPVITIVCFLLILFYDKTRNETVSKFDFYTFEVILTFTLFVYNGLNTGFVTVTNAMWYSVPSILAFFIGRNRCSSLYKGENIYLFLFLLSTSLSIPHIPITIEDVLHNGLVNPDRSIGILDDDVQRAVTGRTVELSLAISGIATYFFLFINNTVSRINKYFVAIAILAEVCTLHYVSRTGVVIFVISIFAGYLLNRKSTKHIFVVIIFLIIGLYFINQTGIFTVFANREIDNSSFSDAGGRTDRWIFGWMMLVQNIHGYSIQGWYAHNFWLDFGREGGLYCFLLLSIFSVSVFIKSIRIYRSPLVAKHLRMLILLFSIIFITTLFTEPVHSGSTVYMYSYFVFSGIIIQMSKEI